MTGENLSGNKFFYGDNLHSAATMLSLMFIALVLSACALAEQPTPSELIVGSRIQSGPQTAPYLMGETDEIDAGLPCNVAAREVYRSLDGKDRHYLVGWLPDGRAHVVVLSDGMIFDPLFHKTPVPVTEYPFKAISISEQDGWHLVNLETNYGNSNLASIVTSAGKQ
jgi:hypothetical protein